jgi:G3E family GTPase
MFVTSESYRDRLPVVLLSGFLGSGKTTLVNRLLRDPRLADSAVAINEFGATPLDQLLIEHGEDRAVVMANGCLCCTLAGDLEEAVMRIFSRRASGDLPAFRRLIIEPSGLADPAPIVQAIIGNPIMAKKLRLEAIVTTVDALFAESQLRDRPECRTQISLADCLVVTKTDLIEPAAASELKAGLRRLNPLARLFDPQSDGLDPADLLPPGFLTPDAPSSSLPHTPRRDVGPGNAHAHHGAAVTAITIAADQAVDWRRFDGWLRRVRLDHGQHLLRFKGLLRVARAQGPLLIQGVHHVQHPPVALERWPDSDRRTRLVFIADRGITDAIFESWRIALPDLVAARLGAA